MTKSIHDKLEKVRKPRVHIKYETEIGNAQAQKELPFVVGVMGDFSCDNKANKKTFKEKKFVQIDRDNFDNVLSNISPEVNLKVENKLNSEKGEFAVKLKFNSMQDFEPENVINQVAPLKKMLEVRNRLRDLLIQSERSEELESFLAEVLRDSNSLKKLAHELNIISEDSNNE